MNESELQRDTGEENAKDKTRRGINLPLVYGLMILALLAAIGVAALIVLPFYQRR